MRGGLALVAVGTVVVAVGVALLTPLLRQFLVDVAPFDPFAFGQPLASWRPPRCSPPTSRLAGQAE